MKVTEEMVNPLIKYRNELFEKIKEIDNALRSLKRLCDHEWEDDGHDSHKNYYKCSICGDTKSI